MIPQWPPNTGEVVERVEARIREGLANMTPWEREAFWRAIPWPFNGGPREPGDLKACAACDGWHRRAGDLCGYCDGKD